MKLDIKFPVRYEDYGTSIFDADNNKVLDVRGWGRLSHKSNPEKRQDAIGEFIVEAMNAHIKVNKGQG